MSTPTQQGDPPGGSSPAMPRPSDTGSLDCDALAVNRRPRIVAIIDQHGPECRATAAALGFA
jgi:hypothetical protein